MIRTTQWKYFFYTNGEEYLYDMTADPGEETNLAATPAHRKLAAELKQRASAGWVQAKRKATEVNAPRADVDSAPATGQATRKNRKP
jgi:arylsulfatase A-like enzyme